MKSLLLAIACLCGLAAFAQPTVHRYKEVMTEFPRSEEELEPEFSKFVEANFQLADKPTAFQRMMFNSVAVNRASHVVALHWGDSLLLFRRFLEGRAGDDDGLIRMFLFDGKQWQRITEYQGFMPIPGQKSTWQNLGADTLIAGQKARSFQTSGSKHVMWTAAGLHKHLSPFAIHPSHEGVVAYRITKFQNEIWGSLVSSGKEAAYPADDLWGLVARLRAQEGQ